jgi:hypothetical protein
VGCDYCNPKEEGEEMTNEETERAIASALTVAAIVAHERRAKARKGKNKHAVDAAEAMCAHIDIARRALEALERCEPMRFVPLAEFLKQDTP